MRIIRTCVVAIQLGRQVVKLGMTARGCTVILTQGSVTWFTSKLKPYTAAYRTLRISNHASFPPSNPHPSGPRSHSAQISHFTLPFAVPRPGACGGRVVAASGLE